MLSDKIYKVVVTGADGFIGKNVVEQLSLQKDIQYEKVLRLDDEHSIEQKLEGTDVIIHLAGVNRPEDVNDHEQINVGFTETLINLIAKKDKPYKLIFSSSTQAGLDNAYGRSKLKAEKLIENWVVNNTSEAMVYRLPGVFGKYCKPDYNSVVSTFCYNLAHEQSINVHNPEQLLHLVYIDDVIQTFMSTLYKKLQPSSFTYAEVTPIYQIKLGQLALLIKQFHDDVKKSMEPQLADEFERCLFTTYKSYLP